MAGYWPSFFFRFLYGPRQSQGPQTRKKRKNKQGQYPAILTKKSSSIKDLLYGCRGIFLAGHGGSRVGKIAQSCPLR